MYRNCESFDMVKNILMDYVPHSDILKSREEDNVLLVINKNHALYFLNEVAKDFLNLCDGNRTLRDIVAAMLKEYDVEDDVLINDLMDIIQELQIKRCVHFLPLEEYNE